MQLLHFAVFFSLFFLISDSLGCPLVVWLVCCGCSLLLWSPSSVSEVLLFPEMCVNFKLVTASQSGSDWKEPQWVDLIPPACLSRVILEPTPQEWVQAVLEHLQ